MTTKEIETALRLIERDKHDPESAHVREDDLFVRVLESIVNGDPGGREKARLALTSRSINFPRWYG